eukprot:CAMPEP_0197849088 /NCGR_PEP_ID=MMETSP1438-20131217/10874_1 /TAXON_ID=1461541 /ORGANISM="Pterosperma sp., Strain CCMP1384" /LENGTH=96 /DNA_ID=CAMNT_0043461615 /DNA_START=336 /DNA_END=626 /DNA_ORIENTATION=+
MGRDLGSERKDNVASILGTISCCIRTVGSTATFAVPSSGVERVSSTALRRQMTGSWIRMLSGPPARSTPIKGWSMSSVGLQFDRRTVVITNCTAGA